MRKLLVAVVAGSRPEAELLISRAEGRNAHVVFETAALPLQPEEAAVKQLCELEPEVVVVSIALEEPERSLAAIRLLRSALPSTVICAVGASGQLQTIVRSIREGAADFIDRGLDREAFQNAIAGLASDVLRSSQRQGKIIIFLGSKGGCGTTTLAVNTAIALQDLCGSVVLVDLALQANAALHLDVAPQFGVSGALANLERMDKHLLESFTVASLHGLALLSGITHPMATKIDAAELLGLFDMLATRYDHILVDCSARADSLSRSVCYAASDVLLVALPNVCSLWSARRTHDFLAWEIGREHLHVVLNRCRKEDTADTEEALQAQIWWHVPEGGDAVSNSVEHGTPLVLLSKPDFSRAIRGMTQALTKTMTAKRLPIDTCSPMSRVLGELPTSENAPLNAQALLLPK